MWQRIIYQWWACEFFLRFTSSQWLHLCRSIDWINKIIWLPVVHFYSLIKKKRLLFLLRGGKHLISETNVLPLSDNVSTSSCGYFIPLKRINKERIMKQTRLERKCYCVFRFGEFLVILFFFFFYNGATEKYWAKSNVVLGWHSTFHALTSSLRYALDRADLVN